ncbi:MAG: hypothetical protein NT160_09240 [Actinobacteria bacterium]|nr:hypothetical protein [Actinomycetota bacterium]
MAALGPVEVTLTEIIKLIESLIVAECAAKASCCLCILRAARFNAASSVETLVPQTRKKLAKATAPSCLFSLQFPVRALASRLDDTPPCEEGLAVG